AAGCRIYRDAGHGRFEIAAQYGSDSKSDALDSLSQVFRQDSQVQEISVGGWRVLAAATRYHGESNGGLCLWKTGDQGAWDADHHLIVGDVANQLGIANQQVANHEHILTLSRTDGMTGLLNRRAFFEEELPRRIGRLRHNGKTSALFYVDMDNFKRVNDVHGHQAGDEAILALCEMLRKLSRPGDLMARLGGDEFAIWLDGVSAEVAEQRAAAVIEASAALRRFSGDSEHPLGVSLGVALYDPVTGENLEELLMRADEAMYAIKNAGKGGYILAQPPGRPPSPDGGS
ncbi:MAG: GGDEF domain-containing protein, partial [Rhodobacterales bacterium]|nr:GGDEF domain-containing protein [Rhodobacterales bacterium]